MYTFSVLASIIAECFPQIDATEIREQTSFREDLMLGEAQLKMLCARIEDILGITIGEPTQFETVGELCDYIEDHT